MSLQSKLTGLDTVKEALRTRGIDPSIKLIKDRGKITSYSIEIRGIPHEKNTTNKQLAPNSIEQAIENLFRLHIGEGNYQRAELTLTKRREGKDTLSEEIPLDTFTLKGTYLLKKKPKSQLPLIGIIYSIPQFLNKN